MLGIKFHHVTCPTSCKYFVLLPCQFLLVSILEENKYSCECRIFFFQSEIELGPVNLSFDPHNSVLRKHSILDSASAVTITTERQSLKGILCTRGQSTNQEDS